MAEKIETKIEDSTKEQKFDLRKTTTQEFLDKYSKGNMARLKADSPEKAEQLEDALESFEESDSADKDIEFALNLIADIIKSRIDYLDKRGRIDLTSGDSDDNEIIEYIGGTIDTAENKINDGVNILNQKEINIFSRYLEVCFSKVKEKEAKETLEEMNKQLGEFKSKILEKVVSEQEAEEGVAARWLKGAREFINKSPGRIGLGMGALLGLAAAILSKLFEASFESMKNMLKNPENPGAWFKPFGEVWREEKKKDKK